MKTPVLQGASGQPQPCGLGHRSGVASLSCLSASCVRAQACQIQRVHSGAPQWRERSRKPLLGCAGPFEQGCSCLPSLLVLHVCSWAWGFPF